MKILYIYREKEKGEYSIEAVFDTVANSMENLGHEVYKWYKPVSWWQAFKEISQLRKQGFDVYHITGDVNYLWLFFPWAKTTMTCHDIGMYKNHAKRIVTILYVWVCFIISQWFIKKMTAVSELTKSDLVNILKISEKKIQVIPNPISLPLSRCDKTFNHECPTILQIGTGWHKNLEGLLESVRGIKCHVEIVGKPDEADMKRLNDYGVDYNISSHLSVDEIICKYQECDILYFVSRSEGFGMPIIEAQTVGRAVITTNTEPTKTVANGAAIICGSEDHTSIHDAIVKLICDVEFRNGLIEKGYTNAAQYNAENIAKMYENFYKETFNIL
ncbi:glycosyltransferase [Bacteroides finegoldii]|jgi:glycosyltransferase involved in cell wall biosynthesis|uniref:glycosyltransferase n=1 Tax=Bacteroides finegoldii TaxID=338188 RepID=UPI0022E563C7|nr:glycosyltransferase [Bacteroides finegoldii]